MYKCCLSSRQLVLGHRLATQAWPASYSSSADCEHALEAPKAPSESQLIEQADRLRADGNTPLPGSVTPETYEAVVARAESTQWAQAMEKCEEFQMREA